MNPGRRAALAAIVMLPLRASAQEQGGTSMSGEGYRPVRLPPRTGSSRRLSATERDAVERRISCPCPCTLDVFTCRTSMPCGFSPRMHQDVIALAEGGYSADEILEAFVQVYGETARMAPSRRGFNLVGWLAPFAALLAGGVVLTLWLRRARVTSPTDPGGDPLAGASPEERRRLEAALRDDR